MAKGKLIIIGGNENKGIETSENDQVEFIAVSILSRVVKESGGPDAKIVIIPTASRIPDEVIENYVDAFALLGCKNVNVADIRKRKQTDLESNLNLVREANCILFSGGDQSKITRKIGGTEMHHILMDRYMNEQDFVIAGTSAGAMCMSAKMITGNVDKEFFKKGGVSLGTGLGLIPNLIIDSHFIQRGRFGRLAEAVTRNPDCIGIGLAEDTAVVVNSSNSFKVIGSGMVIVFDASELTFNNEASLENGEEITIANLKTHILAKGTHFCLYKREILHLDLALHYAM